MISDAGGQVINKGHGEYGFAKVHPEIESPLLNNLSKESQVWMSHGDEIENLGNGYDVIARSSNDIIAAIQHHDRPLYGVQFHPEVVHTLEGNTILSNFLFKISDCLADWTAEHFISDTISEIQEKVGENGKVITGISGGVDSSIVGTLLHKAIGDQLTCIFVNNGLMRREEPERVIDVFEKHMGLNLIHVKAEDRFLRRLDGVTDPEKKRHAIGEEFIKVFEEVATEKLGFVEFLAQGTLYPDVIESQTVESSTSAKIKTHHNVGGLPSTMSLKLVEPLRYLFKDEVREAGLELGLPEEIIYRQPFPGPGLAIRILGEITKDKLEILRSCDWIVMDEIKGANLYRDLWQSFAVLTDARSVGVMGDFRTYGYAAAIRAVTSQDAMTADWARLPYEVLANISNRIVNEVPEVNRVVYDITSKPPGTIEWE